jgi:hypothetical protein
MKNIKTEYPKLTIAQIGVWEGKYKIQIPEPYIKFLLENNGGTIKSDNPDVVVKGELYIDSFFSLFTDADDINGYVYVLKTFKDRYPSKKYFPICIDKGGNLFLMGITQKYYGHIFFWHHELETVEHSFNNLQEFLDSLFEIDDEKISYGEFVDIIDSGTDEEILALINSGWDIETLSPQLEQRGIHRAIVNNKEWLVKEFIFRKANLSGTIDVAINVNKLDLLELLINSGANIEELNSNGDTPLQDAVKIPNANAVKILLMHGANKNIINEFGRTPLQMAENKKKRGEDMDEIIKLLSE